MATDQQRPQPQLPLPNAPFPTPPPFWKHFTTGNMAQFKALEDAAKQKKAEQAVPELPPELQYLRPPTPPPERYTIFGEEQTVCASLAALLPAPPSFQKYQH
jgi:mediator of RNA polymerase II transcription subunit 7